MTLAEIIKELTYLQGHQDAYPVRQLRDEIQELVVQLQKLADRLML